MRSASRTSEVVSRSHVRTKSYVAMSLIADAGARRQGDRLQPGSSGFDSHRRLFGRVQGQFEARLMPPGQRRTGRDPTLDSWLGVFRTWVVTMAVQAWLAQLAEHQTEDLAVAGSIPVPPTAGESLRRRGAVTPDSSPRETGARLVGSPPVTAPSGRRFRSAGLRVGLRTNPHAASVSWRAATPTSAM